MDTLDRLAVLVTMALAVALSGYLSLESSKEFTCKQLGGAYSNGACVTTLDIKEVYRERVYKAALEVKSREGSRERSDKGH